MEPTIKAGDHMMMEGVTYLFHKPHRGDLMVFKTDGLEAVRPGEIYVKRLVGEPGETLRLMDGKIFVNDRPMPMQCSTGEIHYVSLPHFSRYLMTSNDTVTVPANAYFVLGDNSTNSWDSRVWGFVPAENVLGRIWFLFSPFGRVRSGK
jgi:signal peptidase I